MARIRTIKPQWWTEGDVVDLSPSARLLLAGASNFTACDYGHLPDDPRQLKLQVLPGDTHMMVRDAASPSGWAVEPIDPFALVEELIAADRLTRIHVGGRTFLHLTRFTEEQKLDKRWTPRCLACQLLSPDGRGERDTVDAQPTLPGTTPSLPGPRRTSPKLPDPRSRTGQDRTGPSAAAAADRRPAAAAAVDNLPTPVAILRSRMQAYTALAALRFDGLRPEQLDAIEHLVALHGDARLVEVALRTLRNPPPIHVSAFIGTWQALPDPGQRLAVVRQELCATHGTALSPAGVCSGCESDRKAASS